MAAGLVGATGSVITFYPQPQYRDVPTGYNQVVSIPNIDPRQRFNSFRLASGYQIALYPQANYLGTPVIYTTSQGMVDPSQFSSFQVTAIPPVNQPPRDMTGGVVTLYGGQNFTGTNLSLAGGYQGDLKGTSIGTGVQSMKVKAGFFAKLYPKAGFQGTMTLVNGPVDVTVLPNDLNGGLGSIAIGGTTPPGNPTGTTLVGVKTQTAKDLTYTRGCGNSSCIGPDWRYATSNCGTFNQDKAARCSGINVPTCPKVSGGVGPTSTGWTNPNANQEAAGTQINCVYDVGNFLTAADVNLITGTTWDNQAAVTAAYDTKLMPTFCTKSVTTCPLDAATGLPMSTCSRFVSTGPDGDVCRTWVVNGRTNTNGYSSGAADAAMVSYCNKNNTPDCACLNRSRDPLYQQVTSATNGLSIAGSAQCFWLPCVSKQNLSTTLVTSDLATPCTTQVCAQFNNISQGALSAINQNEFNQKINCAFPTSPAGVPPTLPAGVPPTSPSGVPPTFPSGVPPTSPSGLPPTSPSGVPPVSGLPPSTPAAGGGSRWWIWLVVGLVILGLLLLVGGGLALFLRRKR